MQKQEGDTSLWVLHFIAKRPHKELKYPGLSFCMSPYSFHERFSKERELLKFRILAAICHHFISQSYDHAGDLLSGLQGGSHESAQLRHCMYEVSNHFGPLTAIQQDVTAITHRKPPDVFSVFQLDDLLGWDSFAIDINRFTSGSHQRLLTKTKVEERIVGNISAATRSVGKSINDLIGELSLLGHREWEVMPSVDSLLRHDRVRLVVTL